MQAVTPRTEPNKAEVKGTNFYMDYLFLCKAKPSE